MSSSYQQHPRNAALACSCLLVASMALAFLPFSALAQGEATYTNLTVDQLTIPDGGKIVLKNSDDEDTLSLSLIGEKLTIEGSGLAIEDGEIVLKDSAGTDTLSFSLFGKKLLLTNIPDNANVTLGANSPTYAHFGTSATETLVFYDPFEIWGWYRHTDGVLWRDKPSAIGSYDGDFHLTVRGEDGKKRQLVTLKEDGTLLICGSGDISMGTFTEGPKPGHMPPQEGQHNCP